LMSVASHYDGSASSYADQYDPDKLWTNAEYPSNLFRLQLVRRLLQEAGATSVYELGVGDATPLVTVAGDGLRVAGNDISPEMVRHARARMEAAGLDPAAIDLLDVQDAASIASVQARAGQFDAVMALGVIPHVADDHAFVSSMDAFLRPGGRLLLQFRNSMFSMFTFNRLSKEFILDELLVDVPDAIKAVVAADLDQRLDVSSPPVRTRPTGDGYDEILSRFHNPFELAEVVRAHGYSDLRFHWYNYHPAYPMLAGQIDASEYRKAQVALEHEGTWRGMFLCSAGLIEAVKNDPS
ncbi:MAG: class I SAM-dependent methyltransferase, partial [Candidatus Nanopelagicales bacterium]|nr:class I SAM-dependent methyltransferase [Candidatus Nanopelagicales bacterium]